MSAIAIGDVVAGKYRIERLLGQGGMGVVMLAMHDDLDQRVAVKVMNPESANEKEWVTRFQREARAAAKIKSEHVVRVFDVGRLENGAPYMVMEYLQGQDLQDALGERKLLPIAEAADYVLQVSEALAEAHVLGIVHRDLKPANLFVARRADGSPCVKILDFGISKVTSSSLTSDGAMTNTSAIVGSPLYMSPEQMKASKNVDRRADIWSLGVILQELVSGMPSFIATTTAELCALVLTAPPASMRELLPNIPPTFEAVVHKCLRREPSERFQSVGELAVALAEFVPGGARATIERIGRIEALASPPTQIDPPRASQADVLAISLGRTEVSEVSRHVQPNDAATLADAQPSAAPMPPTLASTAPSAGNAPSTATNAAWGTPTTQAPARKVRIGLIAAAIGGLAVLGGIAAVASRTSTATTAAPEANPTLHEASAKPAAAAGAAPTQIETPPAVPVTALPASTPVTPTVTAKAAVAVVAPSITKDAAAPTAKPSAKPHAAPIDTSGFGGRN